jgi:uncharacterized protein (DUF1499 family)
MLKERWVWLGFGLSIALTVWGCAGVTRSRLGVRGGNLAPCPNSPNCVSTQADDALHGMEPLRYETSREEAKQKLLGILRSMPRTRIVENRDDYVRAKCRSRIFRFVDDVEFYFDDAAKQIHFRSASRLGYSDLGVNRERMEAISKAFHRQK